ncbi:uncharacterized protein [Primulina eburnea]|uniref:uncharacterized protein isoform X1 n=1 Tax=Primulina eburnea TaxID=1245227 RepID=UPI003C6CBA4B
MRLRLRHPRFRLQKKRLNSEDHWLRLRLRRRPLPVLPLRSLSRLVSLMESPSVLQRRLKKRSRAEFINKIEELTKHGEWRVVENVRKQLNELKAQNSDIKPMKQEALKTRQSKEESQRDMGRFLNLGIDFIQHDETIMLPHLQQFVGYQTAHKLHHPFGPIRAQMYPPNNGLKSDNQVGPSGIPDPNLSAEEAFGVYSTQPLDVNREIADKRARFAEARRMRKGLIKIKSMRSACGIKLSRP